MGQDAGNGGVSVTDPIDAWRRKATDTYTVVWAVIHLVFVVAVLPSARLAMAHNLMTLGAWSLTCAAAVLRRLPVNARVALLMASSWVYAAAMLDRGGVFLVGRPALMMSPMIAMILGGLRFGLAVGAVNLCLLVAAFRATEAGWLAQAPPPWREGEWLVQAAGTAGLLLPHVLLIAWFSHHLITSIRRQHVIAASLRREAADRERLEGEVLEAGERESRRIGAELHDGVCQDLTGLLIRGKRAQKALEAANRPEAHALHGIVEGLGEAIGEVHGLSKRLSPGWLTGRDLSGAIDDLVRRTAETTDVQVGFRHLGDAGDLDPRTTVQLFRIVQEALGNAVRHAEATRIDVVLSRDPEPSFVRVDDNGRGLPDDAAERGGLGLHTLRWRAARIGGILAIGPRPGRGTRVECRWPARGAGGEVADES